MGLAYEMALVALQRTDGTASPTREAVTQKIIDLAKAGERDPERLCNEALKATQPMAPVLISDPSPLPPHASPLVLRILKSLRLTAPGGVSLFLGDVRFLYREDAQRQVRELPCEILRSCNATFSEVGLIRTVGHAHGHRHELVRVIELCANRHKTLATTIWRLELAELHMGDFHETPPVLPLPP